MNKIENWKLKIENWKLKIENWKLKIENSKNIYIYIYILNFEFWILNFEYIYIYIKYLNTFHYFIFSINIIDMRFLYEKSTIDYILIFLIVLMTMTLLITIYHNQNFKKAF